MKIDIERTNKLTTIDGVPVRVWEGRTESGIRCVVLVHRIAVKDDEDQSEFERELDEVRGPIEDRIVPLRMIL